MALLGPYVQQGQRHAAIALLPLHHREGSQDAYPPLLYDDFENWLFKCHCDCWKIQLLCLCHQKNSAMCLWELLRGQYSLVNAWGEFRELPLPSDECVAEDDDDDDDGEHVKTTTTMTTTPSFESSNIILVPKRQLIFLFFRRFVGKVDEIVSLTQTKMQSSRKYRWKMPSIIWIT